MSETNSTALTNTARIVSAVVGSIEVAHHKLPDLVGDVLQTMRELESGEAPAPADVRAKLQVPVARSIFASHIICMVCRKEMTMLKRHLRTRHGLTPDQYRTKYDLPRTYPMVPSEYAEIRSAIAKETGLGKISTTPKGVKRKPRR